MSNSNKNKKKEENCFLHKTKTLNQDNVEPTMSEAEVVKKIVVTPDDVLKHSIPTEGIKLCCFIINLVVLH